MNPYSPAYLRHFLETIIPGLLLLVAIAHPALAHRVDVFCWVEGKQILCESKFSDNTPVNKGRYEVYLKGKKKILLQGQTDDKGKFAFELPQQAILTKSDLKVVINASMGHKNSWTVQKEEFLGEEDKANSEQKKKEFIDNTASQEAKQELSTPPLTEKQLRTIVHEELIRELGPIKRELAELSTPKIDPRDVMGGIGYIIGLFGLFWFIKSRQ